MELKSRETFLKEVHEHMNESDDTILESIVWYRNKYLLDDDYLMENLISQGIMEELQAFCKKMNLIKDDEIEGFDI